MKKPARLFSKLSLLTLIFISVASVAQSETKTTCEDFSKVFGSQKITQLKKEALFKDLKGMPVDWIGTVVDVQNGIIAGNTVSIKCLPNTLHADVIAYFGRGEKPELLELQVGQKVRLEGKLDSWGELLPHSIVEAKLLELPSKKKK